jgi:hypothetical protein
MASRQSCDPNSQPLEYCLFARPSSQERQRSRFRGDACKLSLLSLGKKRPDDPLGFANRPDLLEIDAQLAVMANGDHRQVRRMGKIETKHRPAA